MKNEHAVDWNSPTSPSIPNLPKLLGVCIDRLNDAIVITEAEPVDKPGPRIVWANQVFYDRNGYCPEEVLGQSPRILQGPGTDRATLDRVRAALEAWQSVRAETLNYRKDGTTYWNEFEIVPIANESGWFTHWVSVQRDVTERKTLEKTNRDALNLLQKIANRVPGVVYQYRLRPDGSSCFPFASEAIKQIYRVSPEDVRQDASKVFANLHPNDYDNIVFTIGHSAKTLTPWVHEYRVKFDDGTVRWLLGNAMPNAEPDGGVLWHGFITDITERKALEEKVSQLAFYDPLTRLPNRRLLEDRLRQAMTASTRSGWHGSLMFLDLDNFKPLNDAYGHAVGDQLLIEVASRLTNCVRQVDTIARLGGDEFVVMLCELAAGLAQSTDNAHQVAQKIHAAMAEPYQLIVSQTDDPAISVEHHCSASIGVVMFLGHQVNQADLMKRADAAMYQAKNAGRNAIRFYDLPHSATS
jgi:diguanylate cyclase (GGDEF)-like protein/PAS domain S-box-containing protein